MATAFLVMSIISLSVTILGVVGKGVAVASAINSLRDLVDIDKLGAMKGFDEGYMAIASQALNMLFHFLKYAQLLVCFCAFLCIIFNAVKLWSGTIELKKVFVDSIYKSVIVMVLMLAYPQVIVKTVNLGTELGVEASGGYDSVNQSFAKLATKVKNIWDIGTDEMIAVLQNGGERDSNGNVIVSDKLLKEFTKLGLTEDEAKQWLSTKGVSTGETSASTFLFWRNSQAKTEKTAKDIFKSDKQRLKFMKQSLSIIDSLAKVLTGTSQGELSDTSISRIDIMTMGNKALEKVFLNPYIENTKRLSVSTMLKTAVVIQEIASSGALSSVDTESDEHSGTSLAEAAQSGNPRMLVFLVGGLLKFLLYRILLVIAVMIVMIEYILCLIEFLVVAAVSAILIPLYFIDATKSFAANILKTIFSFFVKIMVTTMMVFFVIGLYINMGTRMPSLDLSSTVAILYYAFTCLLGVLLVKKSGSIAASVISGNPSLGIGDIANEMRGLSHMGHSLQHAASDLGRSVQNVGQAGKKTMGANLDRQDYKRTLDMNSAPAFESSQKMMDRLRSGQKSGELNISDKEIKRAGKEAYNSAMRDARKNTMDDFLYKKFTGKDFENSSKANNTAFENRKNERNQKQNDIYQKYRDKYARGEEHDIPMPEPEY
mgnify:CR=1 FL=1